MTDFSGPIRVLQVVPDLGIGGIQAWLTEVASRLDRARFQMDFVVHRRHRAHYAQQLTQLGSRVFHCPAPPRYTRAFRRILREFGPYHIVHSHCDPAGYPLRAALAEGVPVRLAHSHLERPEFYYSPFPLRFVLSQIAQKWIRKNATGGFGVSTRSMAAKFGAHWKLDSRWRLLPCAIPLAPFRECLSGRDRRREWGISETQLVLGNVGRLHSQKNQKFLFPVIAELKKRKHSVVLVLVGEGEEGPRLEKEAQKWDVFDDIIWAGARNDVPSLMRHAFDILLMPSLYEGLPLCALEAQAAGLPLVLADTITAESDLPHSVIRRLPARSPAAWADAVEELVLLPRPLEPWKALEGTPFEMGSHVAILGAYYEAALSEPLNAMPRRHALPTPHR